jgi:biotin carboxylase
MSHRVILLTKSSSYRNKFFTQAAARLGIEVILGIDIAPELAQSWQVRLPLQFNRPHEAAQTIANFARHTPVQAVLAVDDSGALVAAAAGLRLGLLHNAPEAAEAARNKHRMRQLLAAHGGASPRFQLFNSTANPAQLAGLVDYPCVVKPLLLSGSRGVMRANNPAEFETAFRRLARLLAKFAGGPESTRILVEDFISGVEVALEGLLHQGRLHVLALFDKPDPLDGPFFEETIYVTPSRLPEATQRAIAACTAQAAAALGLRVGPIHAELRVNQAGPWIVEIAGRSIGGLCSKTLRFGPEVSLEELILRQAVGLPLETLQRQGQAQGVMMIPIPGAGVLKAVTGVAEAQAVPGIEAVEITAQVNQPLTPLPEGESYLGFIFAQGNTPEVVESALRTAHARLRFDLLPLLTFL